jgi:D-alanine-D-alanine ligase
VIVEASAHGREVECSLLGNEEVEASPPGELRVQGEWYDYEHKYGEGGMELIIPAPIPAESAERLRELAVEAFRIGGCSGLARCDFFVEDDGTVLVNEVNTMPGFTETSVYAKLWEAAGLGYPDLCDRLLRLAIERHAAARSHEF